MVAYGQGVWLALQGSAQVRLYHAQSWESLTEVDVAPAVHKMLAGRQVDADTECTGQLESLEEIIICPERMHITCHLSFQSFKLRTSFFIALSY